MTHHVPTDIAAGAPGTKAEGYASYVLPPIVVEDIAMTAAEILTELSEHDTDDERLAAIKASLTLFAKGWLAESAALATGSEPAPSALVAEPGEPVAWEQRHRENSGEWSKWYPTSKKAFDLIGTEPDGSLQARPLYAAPPARQDGALREAAQALADQWTHYRTKTSMNQQDAYWTLVKGQWSKWDALAAALAQSAAPVQPGSLTESLSAETD